MTVSDINFTSTGRHGIRQELALLVEAARRGDLQVRQERRWPTFVLNGLDRPDIRPAVAKLLADGKLEVVDRHLDLAPIVPAGGVR